MGCWGAQIWRGWPKVLKQLQVIVPLLGRGCTVSNAGRMLVVAHVTMQPEGVLVLLKVPKQKKNFSQCPLCWGN